MPAPTRATSASPGTASTSSLAVRPGATPEPCGSGAQAIVPPRAMISTRGFMSVFVRVAGRNVGSDQKVVEGGVPLGMDGFAHLDRPREIDVVIKVDDEFLV